jgi:hypothetical protein
MITNGHIPVAVRAFLIIVAWELWEGRLNEDPHSELYVGRSCGTHRPQIRLAQVPDGVRHSSARRHCTQLRAKNLLDTDLKPAAEGWDPHWEKARSPDGSWNDLHEPGMGASRHSADTGRALRRANLTASRAQSHPFSRQGQARDRGHLRHLGNIRTYSTSRTEASRPPTPRRWLWQG